MKTTYITRAGIWTVDADLVRAKTIVVSCDRPSQRFELHLDRTTAARLHHTGFRPALQFDREMHPVVTFINDEQPDEWFEWRCAEGGALWVHLQGDDVIRRITA